ncbi:MAG: DMT family transporter [Provencibacterium sp.]|jgi:drug/metabolite transporter (DMT)-like permease|nr:DMT family transporter [Provencibacterium sp.]
MEKEQKIRLLSQLGLLLVAIIWGWGFMATRLAVDDGLSASFIMMGRFIIAAAVFGIAFGKQIRAAITLEMVRGGVLVGVFLFLGFMVQTLAMERTTPSNAAFLTATNVVMVPFLWWAAAHRRPPVKMVAACVVCLVGIGLLSFQPGEGLSLHGGDLLALLCAFFFACQIVLTGILAARMDAKVLVFLQFVTAAVLSAIAFFILDGSLSSFRPSMGLAAVGYLGVFSTCLCYLLQTLGQQHVPASKAALILCMESLFGSLFSVMMGYDRLTGSLVAGGLVIMGSVVLSEANLPLKRKKAEKQKL